ncbi:hypothetical protein L6164_006919 [Bauhinia variegata]|uniref:Uncharacterized protein n=1 Tax=Bauhinia variegata TaxID=167791 RepID=A0ACB9PWG4_BAUVA|nr:hypothetical protein L6164_006919 [Bauhinia variegata]
MMENIMKSSSTVSLDMFHICSKRERCFNSGTLVPFILTSLFVASILSFFLFYSPYPFSVLLNQYSNVVQNQQAQNQQDHLNLQPNHATSNSKSPQNEEEKSCDLSNGHWVPALRESSYYSNSSCRTIPDSKNCFKNGREDSDFLDWRWKPEKCELPSFDPRIFLHIVRGKKMGFIGDSVARNHMESLLCLLSQEESPKDVHKDSEDRFRTWYFPNYEFTLMILWSRFLIVGEERMVNGTGSSIFDLQLDKVDEDWAKPISSLDYAIISAGQWFFRVMYLHEHGKPVGCVYCREPNLTDYNVVFPIRKAFQTAFSFINGCNQCRNTVTLLRTFAPAHFENGLWNTGGYCNRTAPVTQEQVDFKSFDWELRNIQIEELERVKKEVKRKGQKFEVVDVTRAMLMRPDGHPGAYWGDKWMKGYNDCTHWCMPGPIDFWNELMLAVLERV